VAGATSLRFEDRLMRARTDNERVNVKNFDGLPFLWQAVVCSPSDRDVAEGLTTIRGWIL
jgi:hypothetical protein